MSSDDLWMRCLQRLETRLPAREATTWLRPIQGRMDGGTLWLHAPNRFVLDHVESELLPEIHRVLAELGSEDLEAVRLTVGFESFDAAPSPVAKAPASAAPVRPPVAGANPKHAIEVSSNTNPAFRFENFVQGKSNEFAFATSWQVAENPGVSYNPLFLYGGVGLGKTHLMHAIGNAILDRSPGAKVYYLHSERFVADMIKALQHNAIDAFKAHYRGATALLIDDIQFFAHKERSQEEFFHTFNALIENHQQVVLTSDRYPKELEGLEERLKSRFSWGVAAHIDPPELETRVAILQHKAESSGIDLPSEVAFFMAKRIRSNVRELEGSLRRVIANAQFTRRPITVDFAKEALRDLLAAQERAVTLQNIQKTVGEYYRVRTSDLISSKRSRSIARPRQMAMALAKELTQHSLPEIGEAFGGRDHTTVMHAVRKISELRESEELFENDYRTLIRILT